TDLTRNRSHSGDYVMPVYAGNGKTVSNYGEGTLNMDVDGRITRTMDRTNQSFFVDPGDEKYDSIYAEYQDRMGKTVSAAPVYQKPDTGELQETIRALTESLSNQRYKPVDQNQYQKEVMSYEEALTMAEKILMPRYDAMYQQTTANALQNLEKSGLYDSLYGQSLAAAQGDAVNNARQQAVNNLGLELVNRDRDWATQLMDTAVKENQFGYQYQQNGLTAASQLAMNAINSLIQQTAKSNDFNLQSYGLALQKQAQTIENKYKAGLLGQMEFENQLKQLEMEAKKIGNQAAAFELQSYFGTGQAING
ncbi:MAG: hypothetical protein RR051_02920, partial [Clostridiales bacterium]